MTTQSKLSLNDQYSMYLNRRAVVPQAQVASQKVPSKKKLLIPDQKKNNTPYANLYQTFLEKENFDTSLSSINNSSVDEIDQKQKFQSFETTFQELEGKQSSGEIQRASPNQRSLDLPYHNRINAQSQIIFQKARNSDTSFEQLQRDIINFKGETQFREASDNLRESQDNEDFRVITPEGLSPFKPGARKTDSDSFLEDRMKKNSFQQKINFNGVLRNLFQDQRKMSEIEKQYTNQKKNFEESPQKGQQFIDIGVPPVSENENNQNFFLDQGDRSPIQIAENSSFLNDERSSYLQISDVLNSSRILSDITIQKKKSQSEFNLPIHRASPSPPTIIRQQNNKERNLIKNVDNLLQSINNQFSDNKSKKESPASDLKQHLQTANFPSQSTESDEKQNRFDIFQVNEFKPKDVVGKEAILRQLDLLQNQTNTTEAVNNSYKRDQIASDSNNYTTFSPYEDIRQQDEQILKIRELASDLQNFGVQSKSSLKSSEPNSQKNSGIFSKRDVRSRTQMSTNNITPVKNYEIRKKQAEKNLVDTGGSFSNSALSSVNSKTIFSEQFSLRSPSLAQNEPKSIENSPQNKQSPSSSFSEMKRKLIWNQLQRDESEEKSLLRGLKIVQHSPIRVPSNEENHRFYSVYKQRKIINENSNSVSDEQHLSALTQIIYLEKECLSLIRENQVIEAFKYLCQIEHNLLPFISQYNYHHIYVIYLQTDCNYRMEEYDISLQYADKGLNLIKDFDTYLISPKFNQLTKFQSFFQRFSLSRDNFEKVVQYQFALLNIQGNILLIQKEYQSSLRSFSEAKQVQREITKVDQETGYVMENQILMLDINLLKCMTKIGAHSMIVSHLNQIIPLLRFKRSTFPIGLAIKLSESYQALKDHNQAIETLNENLEYIKNIDIKQKQDFQLVYETFFKLGCLLQRTDQNIRAEDIFNKYRDLIERVEGTQNSFYAQSIFQLGVLGMKLGQYDIALRRLESAFELNHLLGQTEQITDIAVILAKCYFKNKRFEQAVQIYEDIIQLNESNKKEDFEAKKITISLLELLVGMKNKQQKEAFYREQIYMTLSLNKCRENFIISNELGNLYRQNLRFSESIDFYKKACDIYKNLNDQKTLLNEYICVLSNLASAYKISGNQNQAIQYYYAALKECEGGYGHDSLFSVNILVSLSQIYSEKNMKSDSIQLLQKALKILRIRGGTDEEIENISQMINQLK